ncbi:7072_t:CDS:10 [Diversispora eburnea]|uniref:7072_t:CDS:1 n=1 Tax=Diversispora eburnea TaxID=1213867 RepID=A0A9N8UXW5_9GLOM|nr:7072_t:CDS:10 [Diversispora eburnea]
MRDKDGNILKNAHVLGFLRRLCKLLFFNIKPIFVFDGGAPELKRITLIKRRKRRSGKVNELQKTAEKILAAQMKVRAIKEINDVDGSNPTKIRQRRKNDEFDLPPISGSLESMMTDDDSRLATADDLLRFIEKYKPENIDTSSELFQSLPLSKQYEIISELRQKSRISTRDRYKELIKNLLRRNDLTQKMLDVSNNSNNKLNNSIPMRIASERNKEFILVKNIKSNGYTMVTNNDSISNIKRSKGLGTIDEPLNLDDNSKAYVDDEESIESVMEKFQALESLESKKSTTPITISDGYDSDRNSEGNGSEYYEPEFFYALWISQVTKEFRKEFENYEELIHKAIYEWDNDEIKNQKTLAFKKKGKIREGDNEKEAALKFWIKFLQAVIQFKLNMQPNESVNNSQPENSITQNDNNNNYSQVHYIDDSSDENTLPIESKLLDSDIIEIFDDEIPENEEKSQNVPGNEYREIKLKNVNLDSMLLPQTFDYQLLDEYKIKPSIYLEHYSKNLPSYFISENNTTNDLSSNEKSSMTDNDLSNYNSIDDERNNNKSSNVENSKKLEGANKSELSEDEFIEVIISGTNVPPSKFENEEPSEQEDLMIQTLNNLDNSQMEINYPDEIPSEIRNEIQNEIQNKIQDEINNVNDINNFITSNDDYIESHEIGDEMEICEDLEISNEKVTFKEITKMDSDESEDEENSLSENYIYENIDNSMSEEVSEYARFLSELQNKDLTTVQKELTDEIQQLNEKQRKEKRDIDIITQTMINECQELLKLFGIPFITAPMEAEAQCAELLRLNLVDGIITDDCDVFLFGGTQVYKNFFDKKKYVECYNAEDFEREFQLDREKLIKLALLLGSDYSEGLPKVGIVTAMEILNEFSEEDGLVKFRDWWLEVQYGTYVPENDENAFLNPHVDDSAIPFQWGVPDIDDLKIFLSDKLLWSEDKVDETIVPVIKSMMERQSEKNLTQTSIDNFFGRTNNRGTMHKSKRIQNIVNTWKNGDAESSKNLKRKIPQNSIIIDSSDSELSSLSNEEERINKKFRHKKKK